jgi:hypothetical protein
MEQNRGVYALLGLPDAATFKPAAEMKALITLCLEHPASALVVSVQRPSRLVLCLLQVPPLSPVPILAYGAFSCRCLLNRPPRIPTALLRHSLLARRMRPGWGESDAFGRGVWRLRTTTHHCQPGVLPKNSLAVWNPDLRIWRLSNLSTAWDGLSSSPAQWTHTLMGCCTDPTL